MLHFFSIFSLLEGIGRACLSEISVLSNADFGLMPQPRHAL